MADITISIVAKVGEYLVKPVILEGKCFLCVNKVIRDCENEKEELTSERDSMQDRVEQVKERTEVIEKSVEKWLNDVENLLEEVADLEQKMRANTGCFQGRCPTWRRYLLCKQMVKKIEAMKKFKGKSNIQPFSHLASLPGIQYPSSKNVTYFESTKVAFNQLWEALQHDGIYMIGVYAMGGSGKTTLVTEVGKKANELNLFDKVISITVSQTPNIRDIQGEMADMLNLKLEEESTKGRAQRLWLSLKGKKRILVIVDDLWGKFNLEDIGICVDNEKKGLWKVIIATREENVCSLMDCQKKIPLGLLSKEESWTLFQKYANIDYDFSKSLDDIPQKLCYECKGLPIAIVAVASSLKGKSNVDWKVVLDSLNYSKAIDDHMTEGVRAALSCLELSYDHLKDKEAQLLFLMCSMFPEDYHISTEDLIRYAIGVSQGGTFSLDSTRNRIEANINKLLQSCLLMHVDDEKNLVKMHDLVRDAALWIAKRSENHKILVNLEELAKDDTVRDCFAISLWYKEKHFLGQLNAPKLEILLLNKDNYESWVLSDATLNEIKGLKVFSVINKYLERQSLALPPSTQSLTNLRTLRLNQWELGDISFITSLTELQVLDLHSCMFNELPLEIGELKRLKLLDLSCCTIQGNYNGAIGKCSQVEELYFSEPVISKEYGSQSIIDILSLPKLQGFAIRFIRDTILFVEPYIEERMIVKYVALEDFNISHLRECKENLLQIAEYVHLKCIDGGCKNIIPDMVGVVGGMTSLTILCLEECAEIECIIDTTFDSKVDALIPKLVDLELEGMENLKELYRGPHLQVLHFFKKLEKLTIMDCPQLHSIFPWECNLQNLKVLTISNSYYRHSSTAVEVLFSASVCQSLKQLEELSIEECHELQHIVSESGHGSNTSKETRFVMPNLKNIYIGQCEKLESIFQSCCVKGKIMLPQLEYLTLDNLENLVNICPENYDVNWPSLRRIRVDNCPKITIMVGSEQRQQYLNNQQHLPSTLQLLELQCLPQLDLISWVGLAPRKIFSLQCLQNLKVGTCENLKFLFSMEVNRSLPELISLDIHDCEELEQVIAPNEELGQLLDVEVYFPKLTEIKVRNCNNLESLFSVTMVRMLPQLSTLDLSGATQLKEVFRHCRGDNTINETEIVLPKLTNMKLQNLPNFVDICQGCKLQVVELKELYADKCPKLVPSLRSIQSLPQEASGGDVEEDYFDNDSEPYDRYDDVQEPDNINEDVCNHSY